MTEITASRFIAASAQAVYGVAKQVERYPDVVPDLDRVTVLEDNGKGQTVTKWDGTISVGPIKRPIAWTEKDNWYDDSLTCQFRLISGDMKRYDGGWEFREVEGGCEVVLSVNFELGVPMLGNLVNKIVDDLMKKNCEDLLEALDRLATGQA